MRKHYALNLLHCTFYTNNVIILYVAPCDMKAQVRNFPQRTAAAALS
jgi:hypothetical protein